MTYLLFFISLENFESSHDHATFCHVWYRLTDLPSHGFLKVSVPHKKSIIFYPHIEYTYYCSAKSRWMNVLVWREFFDKHSDNLWTFFELLSHSRVLSQSFIYLRRVHVMRAHRNACVPLVGTRRLRAERRTGLGARRSALLPAWTYETPLVKEVECIPCVTSVVSPPFCRVSQFDLTFNRKCFFIAILSAREPQFVSWRLTASCVIIVLNT